MTHVRDSLISCRFNDEVDHSWQVLQAHVLLIEIPILLRRRIERQVSITEAIAPIVTHPDIVACSGQDESICSFRVVPDPLHHVAVLSMHHQDDWLLNFLLHLAERAWDAIH